MENEDNEFEVLKKLDFWEILNKDKGAIKTTKTMRFLSYYALPKIYLHKYKFYLRFILYLCSDVNQWPWPIKNHDQHNLNAFHFVNCSFCNSETEINLDSYHEKLNTAQWVVFKKKALHFIHIMINSLLLKMTEFIFGIEMERYDFPRHDQLR